MQCSICGAPASNNTPGSFDGLIVSCPHCGQYEITGTVMNKLLRMPLNERMDVLQRAKAQAPPGARPAITSVFFSP
jgi:hypothetical protein